MLFVHNNRFFYYLDDNNKYLSLIGLLTLLQWACIVLHPAKYFDIYGVKWLNKQKQVGLQIGLGSCSMQKRMKGNVWRIKKC